MPTGRFDPTAYTVTLSWAGTKDRPIGGLGIHLIRSYVDGMSFEFRDGMNALTLVKKKEIIIDALKSN